MEIQEIKDTLFHMTSREEFYYFMNSLTAATCTGEVKLSKEDEDDLLLFMYANYAILNHQSSPQPIITQ